MSRLHPLLLSLCCLLILLPKQQTAFSFETASAHNATGNSATTAVVETVVSSANSNSQDKKDKKKKSKDEAKIDGDQLLSPDHIVQVEIEIDADDWATLTQQTPNGAVFAGGNSESSNYTYFKGDIWIDGTKIKNVGIRKKGFFGSNDQFRPSLKIKFDEFKKQNPVKGLDRLTLNNNKQDRSLLSQFLAYQVFRDAGVAAPRSNFAKVTVNGQYLGLYSNVESIKDPFLKRNFGSDEGALYEGAITDFHPKAQANIESKNKAAESRQEIQKFTQLLASPGDLDLQQLESMLDLDSFLRYWATESLLGFWDGYTANQNNYYVYFSPDDQKARFIPWGADWVFTSNGPFGGFGAKPTAVYAQSILANRLYHTPGIPQRYRQASLQVLNDAWNEDKMDSLIDKMQQQLVPHLGPTQQGVPQAMEELKTFIGQRRQFITESLADGPVEIAAAPRKPAYQVEIGTATGKFTTHWHRGRARNNSGQETSNNETIVELKLDSTDVALSEVETTIGPLAFGGFGGFGGPGFGGPGFGGPGFGGPGGPGRGGRPGVRAEPPKLAQLNIRATKESGDSVTLSITIPQDQLKPEQTLAINGHYTERSANEPNGRRGFGPFGPRGPNRSLQGEIVLSAASAEEDAEVAGSFQLKIVETRGGMFAPPAAPKPAEGEEGEED